MKAHTRLARRLAFACALPLALSCAPERTVPKNAAPERTAPKSAAPEPGIPLRVDVPAKIREGMWPVSFGVPFPKGALAPGMHVSVTANGKPVPTQTTSLASWTAEGTETRWLLVDFQIDAAKADSTEHRLLVEKTGRKPASTALACTRDGEVLRINTGAAQFVVRDRGRLAIESARVGRRELVRREQPVRFLVADHAGKTYYATGNLDPDGATIEDSGPCRLALRSEGWYEAEDGTRFCRHIIRMEFFAGSPLVHLFHTWVFTGTSDSHQVRDLGFELPINAGDAPSATFGTSDQDPAETHRVEPPGRVYLLQEWTDRWHPGFGIYQAGTAAGDVREAIPLARGSKTSGWCDFSGGNGGVTVGLRDAWQNHPNEFEVEGNTLRVRLLPRHGRMLDFRTRAVLQPYGEDGIGIIDKFFLAQNPPYTKSIFDVYNNAMGLAKTHELWLDFHDGPMEKERSVRLARQAQTPVLAMADPAWNCAAGALGPLHPRDPARFPEVEAALDAMFDRFVNWRRHFMDYGWLDYGDVHNDARDWDYGSKFAGGSSAPLWRYWDSTHYGLPNAPWLLWHRSGERKYLEFAESNARHCMDIDRCHHGDGKDRHRGGHYYCDWSLIHWGGHTETHINYDKLDYMLYAYYMRGYRRGLEVMKDWAELHLRFYKAGKDRDPFQMLLPPAQRLDDIRHFGPPLGNMTELYRATWDERYLAAARDWAAALVEMVPKERDGWKNLGAIHFCWEAMANYVRLTGDAAMRDALLAYAQAGIDFHFGYGTLGDATEGFLLTRDPLFLTAGKARLLGLVSGVNVSDDPRARGAAGLWTCGSYPFVLRSIPGFLAALSAAPEAWRKRDLPLWESNRSLHLAGPRLSALYVKPVGNEKPVLRVRLGQKQELELKDSAGRLVRHVEASTPARLDALELPAGADATYTLSFPLRPTRSPGDFLERGNVDLVDVENARLAIGPSTTEGYFCLSGPRLYFFVPREVNAFTVTVDTSDTWTKYGWFPKVSLFAPDGSVAATGNGPGKLELAGHPGPEQTGRLWSLGPLARLEAPRDNATWAKPWRPADAHFPAWFKLSDNLPQFVTPNPELFFLPEAAKR